MFSRLCSPAAGSLLKGRDGNGPSGPDLGPEGFLLQGVRFLDFSGNDKFKQEIEAASGRKVQCTKWGGDGKLEAFKKSSESSNLTR